MAVTTTDPVLPAELPSRNEPLSLDVTTDPVDLTITVKLPSGAWEVAYQDGVFAKLYQNSTRAGSHFEITRVGGWPAGGTVTAIVKEAAPVVVVPPPSIWTTLYDIDFTAQPSQTILTSAPSVREVVAVIGGKNWFVHSSSQDGLWPVGVALTNGTGLAFGCNNTQSVPGGSYGNTASHVHLRLSAEVPTWNPAKPTAVMAHFTAGPFNVAGNGVCVALGTWDGYLNQLTFHAGGLFAATVAGARPTVSCDSPTATCFPTDSAKTAATETVYCLARYDNVYSWSGDQVWTGTLPRVEDIRPLTAMRYDGTLVKTSYNGLSIYCQAGFNTRHTVTLKHLRVLQIV